MGRSIPSAHALVARAVLGTPSHPVDMPKLGKRHQLFMHATFESGAVTKRHDRSGSARDTITLLCLCYYSHQISSRSKGTCHGHPCTPGTLPQEKEKQGAFAAASQIIFLLTRATASLVRLFFTGLPRVRRKSTYNVTEKYTAAAHTDGISDGTRGDCFTVV